MEEANLYFHELERAFSGQRFVSKAKLRDFYRARSVAFSETTFRRILYALEKRTWIVRVDAGVYTLANGLSRPQSLRKFSPTFSPELRDLYTFVKARIPYTEYLLWETRVLHEFMRHQPGQNQIILETEKEAAESVFNLLNERYAGEAFLLPDRLTFERYILPRSEAILVTTLVTQSPHHKVADIPTPKLEKILVDVFANEEIFYVFHGEELAHIFETAFQRYQVSQKALFRYAERRKVTQKIRAFMKQKMDIPLIPQERVN